MAMSGHRYRADLIQWAVREEDDYGIPVYPINKGVGLVNSGVTLADPSFEWTPFYGVGVQNRDMLFPVQGRQVLQGSISNIMYTHDHSRFLLSMTLGSGGVSGTAATAASVATAVAAITDIPTAVVTAANTARDAGSSTAATVATASINALNTFHTNAVDAVNAARITGSATAASVATAVAAITDIPTAVVTAANTARDAGSSTAATVATAAIGALDSFRNTARDAIMAARDMVSSNTIKGALVQPSFSMGTVFRYVGVPGNNITADNAFTRVYAGCKISRCTINLNEGQPVTISVDYIARDVKTRMLGTASNMSTYNPKDDTDIPENNAVEMTPITDQPYFFSNANLKFNNVTFARFRSLSIVIDNQLDPRYYINSFSQQSDGQQILSEILEGRRAISIRGQLDADTKDPSSMDDDNLGNDPYFLRYLLQQGDTNNNAIGDMIKGISLVIELQRHNGDITRITIPDNDNLGRGTPPAVDNVGLVLRSAPHNIPAPPAIHIPVDIDGLASSIMVEIEDA